MVLSRPLGKTSRSYQPWPLAWSGSREIRWGRLEFVQHPISVNVQGIAMGCVVGGFGGGALVFNFIQVASSCLLGGHYICWHVFSSKINQTYSYLTDSHNPDGDSEPKQCVDRWTLLRRCCLARLRFNFCSESKDCLISSFYNSLIKPIAARVPNLLLLLASLYLTLQMVNI